MKEPVDHIERPTLPWRTGQTLTECGLGAVHVRTMTRTDYSRRLKEWGQQRTAITTCVTCYNTARRHGTWEEDPRQAVEREIAWEGNGRWSHNERGTQFRDELKAIAILIERHKDEFTELCAGLAGTVAIS